MIYLASDHRGFELKVKIKSWLREWGETFEDFGPETFIANDDYPDYISRVGQQVSAHQDERGIVFGLTGEGEAIVCNKYRGVRTAVYSGGNIKIVKLSREHNDANVLSLGAGFIDEPKAKKVIKLWLDTKFSVDVRHIRRLEKIRNIEALNFKID